MQIHCIVIRYFRIVKQNDMKNWNIFTAETTFDFGRYKGKTLEEVAQTNASYILWCARNIEKFLISIEDLTSYQSKYPIVFSSYDIKTGIFTDLAMNQFGIHNSDTKLLEAKWKSYDFYLELQAEADLDCFDDYSVTNNTYYNDNLDLDQQDQEFWDSF